MVVADVTDRYERVINQVSSRVETEYTKLLIDVVHMYRSIEDMNENQNAATSTLGKINMPCLEPLSGLPWVYTVGLSSRRNDFPTSPK